MKIRKRSAFSESFEVYNRHTRLTLSCEGHETLLWCLETDYKYQKQGSASELLFEVQEWLRVGGMSTVLWTRSALIPFYSKRGFDFVPVHSELPLWSRGRLREYGINFSFNLQEIF